MHVIVHVRVHVHALVLPYPLHSWLSYTVIPTGTATLLSTITLTPHPEGSQCGHRETRTQNFARVSEIVIIGQIGNNSRKWTSPTIAHFGIEVGYEHPQPRWVYPLMLTVIQHKRAVSIEAPSHSSSSSKSLTETNEQNTPSLQCVSGSRVRY